MKKFFVKIGRNLIIFGTGIAVLTLATSCKENKKDENVPIGVTEVSLNDKQVTMAIGETRKLDYSVIPANADNPGVRWESDNTDVITINLEVLTAVGAGTATITVITWDGDFTDFCEITVPYPGIHEYIECHSFEPLEGTAGTLVKLKGKGFGTDPENIVVRFNNQIATVVECTDTQIEALTPEDPGMICTIYITKRDGSFVSFAQEFTYIVAQPTVESIRALLADKQATKETAALFYNLKMLSETHYIIGVHENEGKMSAATNKLTGQALFGTDFMFITDYLRNQEAWWAEQQIDIRNRIKERYRMGEVITMCWHYRNPILDEPDYFYWSALIENNPNQQKIVPRLIPGGDQHDRLKASLDIVADFANTLVDDHGKKIPIIFRPWHEQNGDWFWWGVPHHCTQEEYIKLWKFTVEYLRDTKGINNFLYAYSPNGNTSVQFTYLNMYGYPGDDYVDIFGVDYYFTNTNLTASQSQLDLIVRLAQEKQKIAAITETGYHQDIYPKRDDIFTALFYPLIGNRKIAFMMFWNGEHFIPSNTYENFTQYVKMPRVITSYNLPDMYIFK